MYSNIIEYVRTAQDVCQSVSSKDHPETGAGHKTKSESGLGLLIGHWRPSPLVVLPVTRGPGVGTSATVSPVDVKASNRGLTVGHCTTIMCAEGD